MNSRLYLVIILFYISGSIRAETNCTMQDISGAKTEEELKIIKFMKYEWMRKATVCQMGNFKIATPTIQTKENKNIIFVFKDDRPIFFKKNEETSIYSPKHEDAAMDKVLVNIWHDRQGNVKRIWYQTIGKEYQVMIYDVDFDGQPDIKTVSKNGEIIESYKWKDNKWLTFEDEIRTSNKTN